MQKSIKRNTVEKNIDRIEEVLMRGVEKIYPSKDLFEKVLRGGKKLRLYQGFDPTGTQLHIGHMTGLMKLRQFQALGHRVIFVIGDGTGQAGDPSGKKSAREKFFTNKELRANAKDYVMQASKIVSFEGENPAKIKYNSKWLNKLKLVDILDIAENFSLQQLEERDLFVERKKRGESINMREFLYPLLQGYDSVHMKVDLEIGGSDQMFNMLCGRTLVKNILGKEKFVLTTPLLTDSHGNKIGKSENNVIALTAKPNELYGMIMNLDDGVIIKCLELLTEVPLNEIKNISKKISSGENPMVYKRKLAFEMVSMLNSEAEAHNAEAEFNRVFVNRQIPFDIPEYKANKPVCESLAALLIDVKFAPSNSEARRLISQGGVKIDGVKITEDREKLCLHDGMVVQVGKRRFVKIKIR